MTHRSTRSNFSLTGFLGLVAVLTGAALASLAVFGPAWMRSPTVLAVGAGLVLGVVGVVLGVVAIRERRRARRLEEALGARSEEHPVRTAADRRADIDDLKHSLDTAVGTLKASKLGRDRTGRSALSALPWLLVLGPPGAGKTAALHQSGLPFPIAPDRLQGVGGTRNCDWFFAEEAVFLDTAGRYVVEPDDAEEWEVLLQTLRSYRPHRPLDGVVVAMSLPRLLTAARDDVDGHAARIRQRINDVIEHLGRRIPVYLVLTKCDRLRGFPEFFGSLSREDREQVWGTTLSREDLARIDCGDADVRAVVADGLRDLADRLLDARLRVLRSDQTGDEQARTYLFPLEFAAACDVVLAFLSPLVRASPYHETALFRGVYLTSGGRDGTPVRWPARSVRRSCRRRRSKSRPPVRCLHPIETRKAFSCAVCLRM